MPEQMPVKMKVRTLFLSVSSVLFLSFSVSSHAEDTVSFGSFEYIEPAKPVTQTAPTEQEQYVHQASSLTLQPTSQIDSTPLSIDQNTSVTTINADLWERIRIGFQLAELDSELVQEHENWYASRPAYMQRMIERSQRYLYHIVDEVEKRGMPTEIALLPMIESAFNPVAYSTSHASGIWQFIPSTGKNFGLSQNGLYDGRRDILAATDAALDYLEKLYGMFGSWELALAAYNWGEGSVSRAQAKNRVQGLPTDYLSLRMPPETRNYVPKLMAIKNIVGNPAAYGLALNSIPNKPYFSTVKISQHMDSSVAAQLAGMPMNEFVALNPGYKKSLLAGSGKPTLLLPVDKVDSFHVNLENHEGALSSWQAYAPRRGETLDSIAKRFGTSVARLKDINAIPPKSRAAQPQTLLVPRASSSTPAQELAFVAPSYEPEAPASSKATHTVSKGDTVASIARRYDMSIAELKSRNKLKSDKLSKGQKLTVLAAASPVKAPPATSNKASKEKLVVAKADTDKSDKSNKKRSHYVIQRGDTVYSIARRFNVAVNDLQRWNNIPASNHLQPGSKLTVYT
ncbi:MAG: LysM peptidoglycan-binding domain-containing protein [Sulfuricellaceae bacterium]|nr:LysM peptidoglycan-binding domain-containing protein [Sulfuricellaceae bacterium]